MKPRFRIIQIGESMYKIQRKGRFYGWNTVRKSIPPGVYAPRIWVDMYFVSVETAEEYIEKLRPTTYKTHVIGYY